MGKLEITIPDLWPTNLLTCTNCEGSLVDARHQDPNNLETIVCWQELKKSNDEYRRQRWES